ncbi:LacI family DNA-binding transcriptional regulator [Alloscardovia omnicolens]|uniref:LacI family DNA-binding transcriptional regulator n=1 Tax=Alloscardovia omnicolens TaxID=419015 RepID=UPI003A64585E
MKRATMRDVALKAGVSEATVSRVLNGTGPVAQDKRRKVLDAANALRFSVSKSASSLASGRTMRIGVLVPFRINSWFNATVLDGLFAQGDARGYEIVPFIMRSEDDLTKFFEMLPVRGNVDAIIVLSFNLSAEHTQELTQLGMPCVGVDTPSGKEFNSSVGIDDIAAMHDVVHKLHDLGHTRIAYVGRSSGSRFTNTAAVREMGFIEAIADEGLQEQYCPVLYSGNEVSALVEQIQLLDKPLTALCVEDDDLAARIVRGLRSVNVRVPQELSVIGFDDDRIASVLELSTIHQDPRAMGERAVDLAVDLLDKKSAQVHEIMPTRIILRATTARL